MKKYKIIGITSSTKIAKIIEKECNSKGWNIKIENHENLIKNKLTSKEINDSDFVIIACNNYKNIERFKNKKILNIKNEESSESIKNKINDLAKKLNTVEINSNEKSKSNSKKVGETLVSKQKKEFGSGPTRHLMEGISYMIPFIAFAGIILGFTTAFGFEIIINSEGISELVPKNGVAAAFKSLADAGFVLFIPILAGFIANSIVGRQAIAPAMILALVFNDPSGTAIFNWWTMKFGGFNDPNGPAISEISASLGFFGGISTGYLVGYGIKWFEKYTDQIKAKWFQTILPILIFPIIAGVIGWAVIAFFGYIPLVMLAWGLGEVVKQLADAGQLWVVGVMIGAMVTFDLGGPVNKIAMAIGAMFATGQSGTPLYDPRINGIAAVSVSVPPMVLVATNLIGRVFGFEFSDEDKGNATSAGIMGFFGMTEGSIPFAAKQPKLYMPAFIIAGMIGGLVTSFTEIGNNIALCGGPIIYIAGGMGNGHKAVTEGIFMSTDWIYSSMYFLPLIIASFTGAFIIITLDKLYSKGFMSKNGYLSQNVRRNK